MIPNQLPILSNGKQEPGSGKVCAEQAVAWLVSGRLDLGNETDHPECVQPVLNALAIAVNDQLPDDRRGEMWPMILRQPGTARPDLEPALSVRMAAWCAEQVLDLVRPNDRQVCRDAIMAARAWADNPSRENAYVAATAAYAAAAHAYAYAAANASVAGVAAYAAYAAAANPDRLLALLAGAQNECERLTGHVPNPPDVARIERLGELVGTA